MPVLNLRPIRHRPDHRLARVLDHRLIAQAQPAVARGEQMRIETPIRNTHRTIGAMLSGQGGPALRQRRAAA